jgi:type IV pilus assembly protein PilE
MTTLSALQRPARPGIQRGLTLIELMVVLAVVAIVSALAYPGYREHVLRSQLGDAVGALGESRVQMEQYFLDQRSYSGGSCASHSVGSFTLNCPTTPGASSYTLVATGSGLAAGFVYTLDQHGSQRTTGLPSAWGSVPAGGWRCWITRRGETC